MAVRASEGRHSDRMGFGGSCLRLANCCQGPAESAAGFLTVVHELVPECQFPAMHLDCAIAQQILVGCRSTKVHERTLLHESPADPDLDAVAKILDSDEAISKDQQVFSAASSSSNPFRRVSVVLESQGHSKCGTTSCHRDMEKGQGSGLPTHKGKCMGCGLGSHRSRDSSCPAKGAECSFCHKCWVLSVYVQSQDSTVATLNVA